MTYQGKAIEIITTEQLFGKEVLNIHILEDGTFKRVYREDLDPEEASPDLLATVRYTAIAARIKDEVAQKKLLAPYESSLIPLPHQILVLEKVMQAQQTRFLLADEVGMGKTIEAGLVLKELKLRGEIKRTLLIVPKSAMLQWQSELKEHFHENFHIYESEQIGSLAKIFSQLEAEEELNFWKQHNQIIISLDAVKPIEARQGWSQERVDEYNKYRLNAVVNADFDLVIIDEAHRVGGATSQVSRYQMAEVLCNAVPNVLLLSATPHRGKSDHFRRVLQLLDSESFDVEGTPTIKEIEPYIARSEKRYAIDYEGKPLFNKRTTHRLNISVDEPQHHLQKALYEHVTNYVRYTFGRAKIGNRNSTGLVMIMFQKLASSSTAAILSAMQTRLARLQAAMDPDVVSHYEMAADFEGEYDDFTLNDISITPTLLNNEKCEEDTLSELIDEAKQVLLRETDVKVEKLIQEIHRLQRESLDAELKILVFTEFRSTQDYLAKELTKAGLSCVTIHGQMDLLERQRMLIRFKEESQVMVATDAAGESLNMQFCHIAFNYDIPWNPMTIEQRIGRVDRIGQKHPVEAFNMLTNNNVDERVYEIIVEKLDLILNELGIDKTSDVLDSTIEVRKINDLYLQSLLDPKLFEFKSEQWIYDIRKKLNNYKSTEGLLPTIPKEEIDEKSAADVKHSPLPVWLEEMITLYTHSKGGRVSRRTDGLVEYIIKDEKVLAAFDSTLAVDNPQATPITLQSDLSKRVLDSIDGNNWDVVPILHGQDETPGFLSIWRVSASTAMTNKVTYSAQFVSDQGKCYGAYANDLWNRLVQESDYFTLVGTLFSPQIDMSKVNENLYSTFSRMEQSILSELHERTQKRMRAMDNAEHRITHIGIENIRKSKLRKLQQEKQDWLTAASREGNVVPEAKQILLVRIDG